MIDANELEDRLIDFAVRVINLADALPASPAGKHIGFQTTFARSGTSPAPNYAFRLVEPKALLTLFTKLKIALKAPRMSQAFGCE